MEPFNIKIGYGDNNVTLTILPTSDQQYKVIYFGAILGAVKYEADCWDLVSEEELQAGDLPFYRHDLNSDRANVILDEATIDEIGEEIEITLRLEKDI
ncbi:MAG: hypothetical protein WKF66_07665 [Pedobacter sp.]